MTIDNALPGHAVIPEPLLAFHPTREEDRGVHPLEGLRQFGPYSRSLVPGVPDPIRIATIAPARESARVAALLGEFQRAHDPRERRDYLPPFPGFSELFRTRVVLAPDLHMELPPELDAQIATDPAPHLRLAEALTRLLDIAAKRWLEFEVLFIYLPDRWQAAFEGVNDNFDLHDYVKAHTAMRSVPTQIVREARALAYPCRASVMWRLGIATYAKAGGIPWKLATNEQDTVYVGIGYALRDREERERFVTCASQVFDSTGAGLEFLVYETDAPTAVRGDNPFLSRPDMRRVMARSLDLYQHGGKRPRKVVVHKATEFRREEVDGCFDAFTAVTELELVQIQQHVPWRGIKYERSQGQMAAARFPLDRGSYVALGGDHALLWTQGNAPAVVAGGRNYFKEGKGIPQPLEIVRFAGHSSLADTARAVLSLTKMNWNNDALYDQLPVTMSFASVLARTAVRITELAPRAYELRYFI
jgi:hypothetical protein